MKQVVNQLTQVFIGYIQPLCFSTLRNEGKLKPSLPSHDKQKSKLNTVSVIFRKKNNSVSGETFTKHFFFKKIYLMMNCKVGPSAPREEFVILLTVF